MAFSKHRRKAIRLSSQPRYPRTCGEKLADRWQTGLFLCVGLDSDYNILPPSLIADNPSVEEALFQFNKRIIEATSEWVCAYKPNLAFYEQSGPPGLVALKRTCDFLRDNYPEIPIIFDAKRGDIASTNHGYAASFFDYYRADAVTVHPYLGREALMPFLNRADKLIFILCRTSNPGGADFQNLAVGNEGEPLYLRIARLAQEDWNKENNVGLVAGATYPAELGAIRQAAPDLPLLIPGVGAQGGDLSEVLEKGLDRNKTGVVINSSRGIIYASNRENFAEEAGKAAKDFTNRIKEYIRQINQP